MEANVSTKFENINLLKNLTNLSLYDCLNLTIDFINNLPYKITTLKLKNLTIINFELKHLENLVSLELKFGQIQTFVLENCFELKTLNLYANKLVEFPQSILLFTKLESLNLRWNNISQIPKKISQLQNLKNLNLSTNKLTEFPNTLLQLVNLKKLKINWNTISSIQILTNLNLQNLIILDLSSNCINEIYLQLPELQLLNLDYNQIVQINLQTPKLQKLYLLDNGSKIYSNLILPKLTKVFIN